LYFKFEHGMLINFLDPEVDTIDDFYLSWS